MENEPASTMLKLMRLSCAFMEVTPVDGGAASGIGHDA
jgi:hypothetical protein